MKFEKLERIIKMRADKLELDAGYSGSYNDGGKKNILNKLEGFKNSLVVKLDLRPSEFYKLKEIEVGEPLEFSREIREIKLSLLKNIKL